MAQLFSARRAVAGALLAASAVAAGAAQAITIAASWSASVSETVTQLSADSWRYSFTINNLSYVMPGDSGYYTELTKLTDYLLPYYADAGIRDITTAPGWIYSTASGNTFELDNAATLTFSATAGYAIGAGSSLAGFSYVSSYGPVKAPFAALFVGNSFYGDPSIPGSPAALADGLLPAPVPEPATYAMMLAGLGLLAGRTRRRS